MRVSSKGYRKKRPCPWSQRGNVHYRKHPVPPEYAGFHGQPAQQRYWNRWSGTAEQRKPAGLCQSAWPVSDPLCCRKTIGGHCKMTNRKATDQNRNVTPHWVDNYVFLLPQKCNCSQVPHICAGKRRLRAHLFAIAPLCAQMRSCKDGVPVSSYIFSAILFIYRAGK